MLRTLVFCCLVAGVLILLIILSLARTLTRTVSPPQEKRRDPKVIDVEVKDVDKPKNTND